MSVSAEAILELYRSASPAERQRVRRAILAEVPAAEPAPLPEMTPDEEAELEHRLNTLENSVDADELINELFSAESWERLAADEPEDRNTADRKKP